MDFKKCSHEDDSGEMGTNYKPTCAHSSAGEHATVLVPRHASKSHEAGQSSSSTFSHIHQENSTTEQHQGIAAAAASVVVVVVDPSSSPFHCCLLVDPLLWLQERQDDD